MSGKTHLVWFAALAAAAMQPALVQRAAAAAATDYPSKFVRLVVPYAAGAGPDVLARILSDKTQPNLGQRIVLDNCGGGGALGSGR